MSALPVPADGATLPTAQIHGSDVVPQPHGGALRPFAKGNRANPGGRTKGPAALAQRIRRETKDGRMIVDFLLQAMCHSRSGKERIDAATLLLAYGFGKPVQPTEDVTPGGSLRPTVVQIVHVHERPDGGA